MQHFNKNGDKFECFLPSYCAFSQKNYHSAVNLFLFIVNVIGFGRIEYMYLANCLNLKNPNIYHQVDVFNKIAINVLMFQSFYDAFYYDFCMILLTISDRFCVKQELLRLQQIDTNKNQFPKKCIIKMQPFAPAYEFW